MIRFHLRDILRGTGGSLLSSAVGPELFTGISIDSRTVNQGEVFFAIKGPNHDGHRFLRDAFSRGAALVVVDSRADLAPMTVPPVPMVVVDDTVKALQGLASYWRQRHPVPALAVVGSVGKTTTKEMIADILSTAGPCLKNPGNLNNLIGLPLSLLELADFHRYAVLEIGSNAPGEVGHLASILKPEGAVITRVGWAHLEGFGTPQALVEEKLSVTQALPPSGWCAVNGDDPSQEKLRGTLACRVITYGMGSGEVTADEMSFSEGRTSFVLQVPSGRQRISLGAFGRHFVENALAAVASVLPMGLPLEEMASALNGWRPVHQRGGIVTPLPGVHFIDDTYNANPLSVEASLAGLAQLSPEGVTVAVLGEMKELGDYFEEGHSRVGAEVARLGIDYLVAVGSPASLVAEGAARGGMDPKRIVQCPDNKEAVRSLRPLLTEGVWVLFKGSRAARMEEIMEPFLQAKARTGSGGA